MATNKGSSLSGFVDGTLNKEIIHRRSSDSVHLWHSALSLSGRWKASVPFWRSFDFFVSSRWKEKTATDPVNTNSTSLFIKHWTPLLPHFIALSRGDIRTSTETCLNVPLNLWTIYEINTVERCHVSSHCQESTICSRDKMKRQNDHTGKIHSKSSRKNKNHTRHPPTPGQM